MSFISPALISRIYQALGRNKGSHAILLLRQHGFDKQPAYDGELMALVTKMADECLTAGDVARAEDHYRLGLALYEACFNDCPVEALRCASGLMFICHQQCRSSELPTVMAHIEQISEAIRDRVLVAQAV